MTGYPSARSGWAMTLLLTVAYILSYVDRSILGLLIESIKADIHLTDEQLGYLIGPARPWQVAFLAVGLPGLLLALPFLLMREPPRQLHTGVVSSGFRDMLRYVSARWRAYFGLVSVVCVMTVTAYSHGFMPSAFARRFGWAVQDYALVNGIMTLALGPTTVAAIGTLCDRWRAAGRHDAPLALLRLGFVAIYYMCISIAGLGLGPTSVGLLSTRLFGEANLHLAVSVVPVLFGLVPLLLLGAIGRRYRAQRAELTAAAT